MDSTGEARAGPLRYYSIPNGFDLVAILVRVDGSQWITVLLQLSLIGLVLVWIEVKEREDLKRN